MEIIQQLQRKEGLDAADASTLLQFLQEQTTPILSLKNAGVTLPTPAASSQQSSEHSGSFESRYRRQQSPSAAVVRGTVSSKTGEKGGQVSAARRTQGGLTLDIASTEGIEPSLSIKDSCGKSFNLSSLEEFPPMGATRNIGGRRRGKAPSNPPRRITLTPVDSQPSSSHFSSGTAGSTWKSNPAFTSTFSSSESPLSLSEERRLLQQERSKRRHKAVNSTTGVREQQNWSHHSVSKPICTNGSVSSPNSLMRGKSVHMCSSDVSTDSTPLKHEGGSLPESPTAAMFATTMPLTSTPLFTSQQQLQVSQRRVSAMDRKALDAVADIYARLISNHLVPNITSEIHFTIQLVTTPAHVPPSTASFKPVDGSMGLFGTADNCVYFAVAVLSRIRYITASLDNATLRLLAENSRIATFHPELASFFAEVSEQVSEEGPSYHNLSQEGRHFGVPFQEGTDNSKNFPHIKAFHAFKKQRDSFYSVLRDWEKYHSGPDWNMQAVLGDRIRSLVRLPSEVCSHAHFARLFRKQLTESCRYPLDPPAVEEGSSLAGHLRKVDPNRLMRLNKRFIHPSTGCGPCPPPSFSHMEEFFTGFILATDSFVFIHHLMATLYAEVLKLHSSCSSIEPRDLPDLVHTMRVLAKFLGFLEFLPHRKPVSESLLSTREVMQPFDILKCVLEAGERGHLCVTIPWVVEYLSMMDPQAAAVEHHHALLCTLMDIYRSVSFNARESKGKAQNRGLFLIATALGWLFEIPNTPTSTFFEHIRTSGGPTVKVTDDPKCLDSQDVITSELLYACCPFLGELRSMLAEFAVGLQSKASPIRKIKPISADVDHSETTTPAKQLQLQLQENFFRSHPPYLKQLCDINSERIAASAVSHCEASILPQHVSYAVRALSEWLKEKYSASSRSVDGQSEGWEPFSKVEAERSLMQVTKEVIHRGNEMAKSFFSSYCRSHAQKTVEVLLTGTLADQVTAVASDVTAEWASEKCSKWIADKFRAAVQVEVYRGFEKLRKNFREALKSGAVSFQTPSVSLSNPVQAADSQKPGLSYHEEGNRAHVLAIQVSPVGFQDNSHCHSRVGAVANSLVLDNSALEEFTTAARTVLQTQAPTTEQLTRLQITVGALAEFIFSTTSLLPGVHISQLLPCGLEYTLTLSVDLVAYLVAHGSLALPQDSNNKSSMRGPICAVVLLESLLRAWKLMKCLKLEIPVRSLMSAAAFRRYTQQDDTPSSIVEGTVWQSLSDVLIGLVLCDVTPSPVVESLWLCRKQQLPPLQVRCLLRAAAIFLDTWYTYNPPEGNTLFEESSVHLREVHFVRLLCAILQDLDKTDIPVSLITHRKLKEIVHPF